MDPSDEETYLLAAKEFFTGCKALGFAHAHFDWRMAGCITKEVLEEDKTGTRFSDAAWTDSMERLENFLGVLCHGYSLD